MVSDTLSGPEALNYVIDSINQTINLNAEGIATFDLVPNVEGNLSIDVTDKAGNSMSEVNKSKIVLAIDDQRPNIIATSPENESQDKSITPDISFTTNEPLFKGDGYLSIYKMNNGSKVMDIHSGNNRVKLSNDNKTVTITLPEMLLANSQYYIVIDEGFVYY